MENQPQTIFVDIEGAVVEHPCDMPDDIIKDIVALAKQASSKFDVDKEGVNAAKFIKTGLDEKHEPHWHVVIGNAFGSFVIHESKRYVYFHLNKRSYMIYKT